LPVGEMVLQDAEKRLESSEIMVDRPVTSLGHYMGRRVFWEGPKFFKLCELCPTHFYRGDETFSKPCLWPNGWYIQKSFQDYIASVSSYFDRKMIVYMFPSLSTLSGI